MAAPEIRETPSARSTGKCRWCNPLPYFFSFSIHDRAAAQDGKHIFVKKKQKRKKELINKGNYSSFFSFLHRDDVEYAQTIPSSYPK
jgi:hypothetical protein